MFRRVSSAVIFMMLLTSMMTAVSNIRSVNAFGPIYINYDGSVDPPDAPISADDNNVTYTFTDNIFRMIVINRSSIVLDGHGHCLQRGAQYVTYGIMLSSVKNVTVRNTNISAQCQCGIYLDSSSGNRLSNNIVTANVYGIRLDSSSDNLLLGNDVTGNTRHGIYLDSSSDNNVSGNNVAGNTFDGIYLQNSSNNTLLGNTATENRNGICLDSSSFINVSRNNVVDNDYCGIDLQYSSNNTLLENTAAGNMNSGIYFYSSSKNNVSRNDVTGIGKHAQYDGIKLECSVGNNISDNKITANSHNGVFLSARASERGSQSNEVYANEITGNVWHGVFSDGPSGSNTISRNNIMANGRDGVWLGSTGNTVYENSIAANKDSGLWLYSASSSGNIIYENNITDNIVYGAYLSSSKNNIIYGNNITNNSNHGIWLVTQSDNNMIYGNNILNNGRAGIDIQYSNNNKVYHNSFAGNAPLASSSSSMNTSWDCRYPSGGNYWADNPDRRDNYGGPDQDQPGSDGIGDTSYVIDSAQALVDNYPLVSTHYVVADITCRRTAVGEGCCINISVTVSNCGTYGENVNLTLHANSTFINQEPIALAPAQAQIINFTWNTSGYDLYGNYSLTACVSPVSEETILIGHNCTDGYVTVTLVGDITGPPPADCPDGVCNMHDVGVIGKAFGAVCDVTDGWYRHLPNMCNKCPHNPNYDTNNDARIDMKDIGAVARHFGEHYP